MSTFEFQFCRGPPEAAAQVANVMPARDAQAAGGGANGDAAKIQKDPSVVDIVDFTGEEAAALVNEHK